MLYGGGDKKKRAKGSDKAVAPHDRNRLRVSDAERDQVAEVLREAAAEGRITLDELDERLDATYAAKTYADLEPLTGDLPGTGDPTHSTTPAPTPYGQTAGTSSPSPMVINSKGGPVIRKGDWQAPARIEIDNRFGATRLDFREARLAAPVTKIHLVCDWGTGDLILPEGATAEVDLDSTWFGTLRADVDSLPNPPAPHFVITGTGQGATVRVRHKRASKWSTIFGG